MSAALGTDLAALLLRDARASDDQSLADAVLADAQSRAASGETITLAHYLTLIPGLERRTVPLDAAIEGAILGATRAGTPIAQAVESLVAEHPALAGAIRDCAVLTSALCATHEIERLFSETRTLPSEFGPVLESGAARYVLLRTLGVGSSGTVYEAEDRVLSDGPARALVALKILTRAEGRFADIHWQEAAKANRVKHPNVVRALDRATAPSGEQYAVFELVDGGDLDSFAARHGPLHPSDAATLVAQTARGVHASHQAGLIHADLKPQNILLARDNTPKVSDFGVARRHDDPGAASRPTGRFGGLAFMAPEQFRDPWEGATIAADVYALGGILFWLLTGELPNGDSRDAIESALSAPVQPARHEALLREHRVPATLRAITLRALRFDPDRRQESAAALADELERFTAFLPVPSASPSTARRAALWGRRHPTAAVGLGCLFLALGAGLFVSVNAWRVSVQKERQDRAVATFKNLHAVLKLRGETQFENESLAFLWIMEWMGKAGLFTDYETWARTAVSERMTIARAQIDAAAARGQGDSLEADLWRIALANFMLNNPDPQPEASELLDTAISHLERSLSPDDELLLQARAMRRVAQVKQIYHFTKSGGDKSPQVLADLHRLGDELGTDLDRLREARPGSPVFLLVLRALDNIYKNNLLNDPDKRAIYTSERRALDQN